MFRPTSWLALVLLAATSHPVLASQKLADKGGCSVCHAADKKLLGPSWREIAAKYAGRPDAAALLLQRTRKGSQGVWGVVPMPATGVDRLSDTELKTVVSWVLKS